MKTNLPMFAALIISLMSGVLVPSLHASEWDRETIIAISKTVTVEKTTLPAGKYMLRLQASTGSRNIVQIFNAEGTHLIATLLAIDAYRLLPAGKNEFSFYNLPHGQPAALHLWFYQGDNYGLEFVQVAAGPQTEATARGN